MILNEDNTVSLSSSSPFFFPSKHNDKSRYSWIGFWAPNPASAESAAGWAFSRFLEELINLCDILVGIVFMLLVKRCRILLYTDAIILASVLPKFSKSQLSQLGLKQKFNWLRVVIPFGLKTKKFLFDVLMMLLILSIITASACTAVLALGIK